MNLQTKTIAIIAILKFIRTPRSLQIAQHVEYYKQCYNS